MDDEIDFIKKINLKNIFTYLKFLVFFFPKRIYLLFLLLSNKFSSRYKYIKKEMS